MKEAFPFRGKSSEAVLFIQRWLHIFELAKEDIQKKKIKKRKTLLIPLSMNYKIQNIV